MNCPVLNNLILFHTLKHPQCKSLPVAKHYLSMSQLFERKKTICELSIHSYQNIVYITRSILPYVEQDLIQLIYI